MGQIKRNYEVLLAYDDSNVHNDGLHPRSLISGYHIEVKKPRDDEDRAKCLAKTVRLVKMHLTSTVAVQSLDRRIIPYDSKIS